MLMVFCSYKDQANADADWVYRRVNEISQQLGPRKCLISESDVRSFCKNSQNLRLIRGSSIADEYKKQINLGNLGKTIEVLSKLEVEDDQGKSFEIGHLNCLIDHL